MQAPTATGMEATLPVASVQAAVLTVQKRMSHYDGSFVQFRCDEKGFLAVCAFGLPGKSHEDGPSRGVKAALSIVAAMRDLQQVCQDSPVLLERSLNALRGNFTLAMSSTSTATLPPRGPTALLPSPQPSSHRM